LRKNFQSHFDFYFSIKPYLKKTSIRKIPDENIRSRKMLVHQILLHGGALMNFADMNS